MKYKVIGYKEIEKDIEAANPEDAAKKFFDSTNVIPSWSDDIEVLGVCISCNRMILDDGVLFYDEHVYTEDGYICPDCVKEATVEFEKGLDKWLD